MQPDSGLQFLAFQMNFSLSVTGLMSTFPKLSFGPLFHVLFVAVPLKYHLSVD